MDNFNKQQPMQNQAPNGQPMQNQAPYGQPMQNQAPNGQPMQNQAPYGQPMQNQAPYGQPMQNQAPYGQPMQNQAPYGQPMQNQAPYGQPMQNQAPYGQPMQNQAPYGQQPAYGQNMNYNKPMGGGADFTGFINSLKTDMNKLIGLIAAIIIMLAPFFPWFTAKLKASGEKESDKFSMFKLGSEADQGIITFAAIVVLVGALLLIAWDIADYVPALANIKAKVANIPVEYIIVGVIALFGIIAFMNGEVKDVIDDYKDLIDLCKKWDDDAKGSCGHGLGPVVLLIGVLGRVSSIVLPKVKKN